MMRRIVIGNRRFTCLSPTLVRIEFAPDGRFDDRASIVAAAPQAPLAFGRRSRDGAWDVLETGKLSIRSRDNPRAASRINLELRWSDGHLLQIWRPGDRDYQNLGGILRSLDRYGGEACALDGVHPATMESPDASATNWPAWIQCEIDTEYTAMHPDPPETLNRGGWLSQAQADRNDGRFMHRTFNWYKDARRFSAGILSGSGYYFLNDSDNAVLDADGFPIERDRPGYQDWYLFAYSRDYQQALRDFRLLSGPAPIPRHQALGIVFSRWPAFSRDEIAAMGRDFAANGYPLSTLVMDMEWHKEGWGHWEFNPELIPDPAAFFALCRKHGLEVTFNDHPLDVREDDCHFNDYVAQAGPDVEIRERAYNDKTLKMARVDICDKQQNRAFLETCSRPLLDRGVDYWWNDGSRGQMSGTCGQLVCNKTFFESSQRDGRRGMLFARHGGLGSHRYGAFFTGDANSDWQVLRLQVELNIRAAGAGVGHVSHDIGGFMIGQKELRKNAAGTPIVDPVRYLRWLQFGVFNPVLRFHCAPSSGSRLPYDYDREVGGACRHWLRVRHRLLPYIYTAARTYSDTGLPPTRGLFIEEPENPAAYRFDQYYFGPDLLVAPMLSETAERSFYVPDGRWWIFDSEETVSGGGEITRAVGLNDYPVLVRAGAILPGRDPDGDLHAGHIGTLHLDVYPGADRASWLYEDDGVSTDYLAGHFCRSRFRLRGGSGGQALVLSGETVEGRPLGAERRIVLTVRLPTTPARVTLNRDIPLTAESDGPVYRIVLPTLPAADAWQVEVD